MKLLILGGIVVFSIGMYSGFETGRFVKCRELRQEAINKGFAHYNHTTGKWQWGQISGIYIENIEELMPNVPPKRKPEVMK